MIIILVAVVSADGFIADTRNPHPSTWSSQEDKDWFSDVLQRHKFHVFGRKTYEVIRPKAVSGTYKLVLTRHPNSFDDVTVPHALEFQDITPKELIARYKNSFASCLVLGGADIYTAFLNEKLVDDVYVVEEPVSLHSGVTFINDTRNLSDFGYVLEKTTRFNDRGTVLHYYRRRKQKQF